MGVTGYQFEVFARGTSGTIGGGASFNFFTVPAGQRWEMHSAELRFTFGSATGVHTFEISDNAGGNFVQWNPDFTKIATASVQMSLAPREPTIMVPQTPANETTDNFFRKTLFMRKFEAGQIMRISNAGGASTITDVEFEFSGIREDFV